MRASIRISLAFGAVAAALAAAPAVAVQPTSASALVPATQLVPDGAEPGTIVETFPVTWHDAILGGEDIGSGNLFFAHELFNPDPNTLWYVGDAPPHTPVSSLDLAALNPGFPVSLNDRTGAAWDPNAGTYFLPDFQGDLVFRDDNIVEINPAGTILNAWELDGAGNDSSDASAIDQLLDIAVVPGTPNRYFMTNIGGNTLFEISLTRAGLFTAASWSTVGSCVVPGLIDNAGVDYDEASGLLYHSDFGSATVVVTDLACNLVATFDCTSPSASSYSGLALVSGTSSPEVWLTDFISQTVTRCALGEPTSVLEVPALSTAGFAALAAGLVALALFRVRRNAAR